MISIGSARARATDAVLAVHHGPAGNARSPATTPSMRRLFCMGAAIWVALRPSPRPISRSHRVKAGERYEARFVFTVDNLFNEMNVTRRRLSNLVTYTRARVVRCLSCGGLASQTHLITS